VGKSHNGDSLIVILSLFATIKSGNVGNVTVTEKRATKMARLFKNKPVAYFLQDPTRYRIVIKLCNRNSLITNDIDISTSLSISQLAEKYPGSV